jgi:Ca2+-transporting ATPase
MPALALGLSPGEKRVLLRPPRDAREPILARHHWMAIFGYGVLIAAAVLGAFSIALLVQNLAPAQAITVGFLTFGLARLWHVFNMRSPESSLLGNEVTCNPFVWVSIAIGVLLLLAAAHVPLLAEVLSTHALSADGWLLILSFSFLPLLVGQVMKLGGIWWEAYTD